MKIHISTFSKRAVLLLLLLSTYFVGHTQNEFYNDGADVYVQAAGLIYVQGEVINDDQGVNIGQMYNSGDVQLEGNWTNNSVSNVYQWGDPGTTTFLGANPFQTIGGITDTYYNNFTINKPGNTEVRQLRDATSDVTGVFQLNNDFLNTQTFIFAVFNDAVNSVRRTGPIVSPFSNSTTLGYVSSDGVGYFSRATLAGVTYFYPTGSVGRFRPVEITSSAVNSYGARFVDVLTHDVLLTDPSICQVHPDWYHKLYRTVALGSPEDISIYPDFTTDGFSNIAYTSMAEWDGALWKDLQPTVNTLNVTPTLSEIRKVGYPGAFATPWASEDFALTTTYPPPVIVCPGDLSVNVDLGVCGATVAYVAPIGTSACTVPPVTVQTTGLPAGSVFPVGVTTNTFQVTDGAGQTATCSFTITVTDNENPTITCPANQVGIVDATCNFTIPDYTGLAIAADNCPGVVVTQVPAAGTIVGAGTTNIVFTATDAFLNTATCNFNVVITDAVDPIALCQNITVYLDAAGNVTFLDSDLDGGSTDNCGTVNFTASTTAFSCADLGPNNVTLTVDDGNGNSANCVAVVTVVDTISPVVVCQNITVFLDGTGNVSIVAADIDGGSSDNCGTVNLSASLTAFTCADIGPNNVTLTVDDGNGNSSSCVAVVTVSDTVSPTAICQNFAVVLDALGNATITTGNIDNGSTDNCGIALLSLDITAFTCADIGANIVTLTVTDGSANTSSCTATVTVTDPNVPIATVGLDVTICDYETVALNGTSGGSATTGAWTSSLDGSFSLNTDPNAIYTPGPLAIAAGSVVLTWTTDPAPCATANASMTITINPAPSFTVVLNLNPSACGVSDGSILISGLDPSTGYTLTYDSAGITIIVGAITTTGAGEYLVTGLGADSYNNWSLTLNGCTTVNATSIGLSDPSSPIFTVAITQQPTSCGGTQGEITISGLIPSTNYDISYDDDGSIVALVGVLTDAGGNYILTGLDAGTYTTFVISLTGCTGAVASVLVLTDPPVPTFGVALTTNPTSCGGVDGSITISGLNPSTNYDITYDDDGTLVTLIGVTTDGAGNYIITGLNAGNYDNWTITDGINCTGIDASIIALIDPGSPTFTVVLTSDPSICGAADGSITISGLLGSTVYDITYDDDGTLVTLVGVSTDGAGNYIITGLNAGSYDNWTISIAGCTGTDIAVITLTDPPPPTFTVVLNLDPTSCGAFDGSILISGLTPGTNYDLGYDDDGLPIAVGGILADAAGEYLLTGLDAGNYDNWSIMLLGCVGTDVTVITLTDPGAPTFTVAFTSDPTSCGASDGSITISGLIGSTNYDITYDDDGILVTLIGVATDAAGNIIITGLDAGAYDNWSVSLLGCAGSDLTLITLVDPGSPTFTVSSTDPTTCLGVDGTITFSGLTPSTSYDITYDDGSGLVTVTVTSDASGDIIISVLGAGSYNGFSASLAGCIGADASTIVLTDPPTPTAPVAGSNASICDTDPIVDLTAVSGFGGSLEWYSDAALLANIGSGTNLTPGSSLGSTVYYVNETSNGCVGPATAITVTITTCVVIEVEIPTGFSPDNDGVNDTWELVNLNLAYPNNIVRVFNRWGTILFESNGYATPWDGKVNGDDLPVASYFFTIEFGDGIRDPETGSVTIIR